MEISEEILKQIPPEKPVDEEIADMIYEGDVEKMNYCFKNIETTKYLFGDRTKSAEALEDYGNKKILCRVKTVSQEAEMLLSYIRVWTDDPDCDMYFFTTELV